MESIETLRSLNPHLALHRVGDPEFAEFGRLVTGYEVAEDGVFAVSDGRVEARRRARSGPHLEHLLNRERGLVGDLLE